MPQNQTIVRARVACKSCNARRVRCDRAVSGPACTNCRSAQITCELIDSQRGKHKRPRLNKQQDDVASQIPATSPAQESPMSNQRCVSPSLPGFAIQKASDSARGKVVYMGDSGNMKFVIDEVGDPFNSSTTQHRLWGDNLSRHMTEALGKPTQLALRNLHSEDEQHLRSLGAFQFPEKRNSDELIQTFFKYSFMAFPVFDPAEFTSLYETGRLSPLILNAVYHVAAIHCSNTVLEAMGFTSRYLACLTFYRRAKALYDADHDTDGIATVQAALLLSNWWGGPMEQKDTWYWLGVAAGLAQALGMHCTKSYSVLPQSHQKLWRRIWWTLYVNDIHHAAVFGRPPHIHRSFCDVQPLTEDDFTDHGFNDSEVTKESKQYLIYLCDLESRVGRCLSARFSSVHEPTAAQECYEKLIDFENTLTSSFRDLPARITPRQGYWPALLQLYYCDYQIVFHRMFSHVADNGVPFFVAGKISRILEALLASSTLYQSPFMVLPAVFASILVNIIQIRKGSPDEHIVAEHRAHLAMHILDKFQDAWPIAVWTRYLLDCLLKASTTVSGSQSRSGERGEKETYTIVSSPLPPRYHSDERDHDSARKSHSSESDMVSYSHANVGVRLESSSSASVAGELLHHAQGMEFSHPAQNRWVSNASFSSLPLLFPLDNFLEDAELDLDTWSLDYINSDKYD